VEHVALAAMQGYLVVKERIRQALGSYSTACTLALHVLSKMVECTPDVARSD
jgi:hypothetical protein